MKIELKPGNYVVAVSGGVDSVVLLHLCSKLGDGYKFLVVHFDHGIRENSMRDRMFVQELAKKYGLGFVYEEGWLGKDVSEENARVARYRFLDKAKNDFGATEILTAHHQDDVLETMIMNLLRGTGRKGMTSLDSREGIARPLIEQSKSDLINYAKTRNLKWVEDETNQDTKYKRNEIRLDVIPKLSKAQRDKLIELWFEAKDRNKIMDKLLEDIGSGDPNLSKSILLNMSHKAASELVAAWLRNNNIRDFSKKTIERIVLGAKTLPVGSTIDVVNKVKIKITKTALEFLNK